MLNNLFKRKSDLLKISRIFRNSSKAFTPEWVDFFVWKEATYYEMYKRYWTDLSILIDRILFYYLWTQKLLKNEDTKHWFEHWFEVLFELLEKNIEYMDSLKWTEEDSKKKQKEFLW